jgi:hypothetical protein
MNRDGFNSIVYFDNNCDTYLSQQEIDIFKDSEIDSNENELKITLPNHQIKIFKNMSIPQNDEYYNSGRFKVAIVDNVKEFHGITVANIIKQENPDLAVHKFDNNPMIMLNPVQKLFQKIIVLFNKSSILGHNTTKNICIFLSKLTMPNDYDLKAISKALQQVKTKFDKGENYEAVNLSVGLSVPYDKINELCRTEIGEEITPENCARYKAQIKEILKRTAKENKKFKMTDTKYPDEPFKLSSLMDVIDKIENLNIPVYVAGAYRDINRNETFNLFSLASNSRTVESGVENPDKSVNEPYGSSSSFALDETGKRRIAKPVHYNGTSLEYCSTSYATPMVLANELKILTQQNE